MGKSKNGTRRESTPNDMPVEERTTEYQAAYFLSLTLENVRCFGPKQTLDLSDGRGRPARWTIILGVNGTGKTTILRSLTGFERTIRFGAEKEKLYLRFYDSAIFDDRDYRRIDVDMQSLFRASIANCSLLNDPHPATVGADFTLLYPPGVRSSSVGGKSPSCFAYGAGRRVGSISLDESGNDDPTATLFSDRGELRNAEEWLLQLDYGASKPSAVQQLQKVRWKRVTELLIGILPDVEDIRCDAGQGTHPKPRAEFKTPDGWIPFRQLGYGYQILTTWVADLASRMIERYPESRNPFAEPAVVLVDEIDLHMHPQWQRKLIDDLTKWFENTQFIATAHSPLIVQAVKEGNIAVLRREGDHVVIDNDTGAIRGMRVDQILTSDLFGLETARPPYIEPYILERKAILTKSKLTKADEKRLKELADLIGPLPTGETNQEIQERELLHKLLDRLSEPTPPK